MKNDRIPMIQIDDTIISIDCLSEKFCCDLDACKGECCIEGDAGAPVELDEVAELEEALPVVWPWVVGFGSGCDRPARGCLYG